MDQSDLEAYQVILATLDESDCQVDLALVDPRVNAATIVDDVPTDILVRKATLACPVYPDTQDRLDHKDFKDSLERKDRQAC